MIAISPSKVATAHSRKHKHTTHTSVCHSQFMARVCRLIVNKNVLRKGLVLVVYHGRSPNFHLFRCISLQYFDTHRNSLLLWNAWGADSHGGDDHAHVNQCLVCPHCRLGFRPSDSVFVILCLKTSPVTHGGSLKHWEWSLSQDQNLIVPQIIDDIKTSQVPLQSPERVWASVPQPSGTP